MRATHIGRIFSICQKRIRPRDRGHDTLGGFSRQGGLCLTWFDQVSTIIIVRVWFILLFFL